MLLFPGGQLHAKTQGYWLITSWNTADQENSNKKKICGVRDSFPVRKLHNSCYDMQNIWAKQTVLMVACKVKAVSNSSKSL